MSNKELNKKLAEWAGFVYFQTGSGWVWVYPKDRIQNINVPDFTDPEWGIALCFKWLVPKLIKDFATELVVVFEYLPHSDSWTCTIEDGFYNHDEPKRVLSCVANKEIATALCEAIEKLIDNKQ